ncbi:MAG: Asp-tRNA(Asn)/Glu-tRNA(Gln) amidotransferase subunit GatA [Kiritimatiellia bacterium]
MPQLNELTISQAVESLERGDCTAEALVGDLLDSIRARDNELGAYIHLDEEDALRQARTADARRRAGHRAPLLGVPLAVKDAISVKGQPCGSASRILEGYTAPYDATAIAKLRAAGALFIGRANMDEFGMGSATENSAIKITRNPWDASRAPGGSSGGSAAMVAANEALAALGSDSGGSIRQPAAFCGCVGLKPSYGRVSRYGLSAVASSLDQIGPLTKTVADAALLLEVMAGSDPLDSTSADVPLPDFKAALQPDLQGMRLGLPQEYFRRDIDPEVAQSVQAAIRVCEQLGAQLKEVSLPTTKYAVAVYYIIVCAEASANLARFDGVRYGRRAPGVEDLDEMYFRTRAAGFGAEVKRRIILGTWFLSRGHYDEYYVRAQKARTLIRDDFIRVFQECDALLAPVTPTPAYKLGEAVNDPLQKYRGDAFTVPASLSGICALSVPCGFTAAGLPVGLQVIGPAFREDVILRVGHAYEKAARCGA